MVSKEAAIFNGVPNGSDIGSLLFRVMVSEIPDGFSFSIDCFRMTQVFNLHSNLNSIKSYESDRMHLSLLKIQAQSLAALFPLSFSYV